MTKEEINAVATATDLTPEEVGEYLEMDFEDEETPDVTELIYHIEYQQSLVRMSINCDNEHDFAEAWCAMY